MGSAKDLNILQEPTENEMGVGVFEFTDNYSVFDYGRMPDLIEGKGAALCAMTVYNFQRLQEQGIKSHLIDSPKANQIKVHIVRREEGTVNRMIPLEVIYRDVLGAESSVFRRLKNNEVTYQDLGLDKYPNAGETLQTPIIDYSTKYEPVDRYFKNVDEARIYAKITPEQMEDLKNKALKINEFLRAHCNNIGWTHIDGKVEFALNPANELVLVDAVGTLDEDRFEYKGLRLSKQLLRDYYRRHETEWHEELAKAQQQNVPQEQWPNPVPLPKALLNFVSNMYKSATNVWTGQQTFNVKSIDDLIEEDYKNLKEAGLA